MTRRAYLYFGLTFVLGGLVGGWGMFSYAWYAGHWHRRFDKQRIVRHLTHDLSLSDTQVQQLNEIVDEYEKKYADLGAEVEPRFAALREERRNRIRQILTPEQIEKFNEVVRRTNERMKKHPPH
jgi:Spy/CpxP family protein refolding chaperone